MEPFFWRPKTGTLCLPVRVRTNASHTGITALTQEELSVNISASPQDGEANQMLVSVLSRSFGISKGSISILSGHKSREKILSITSPASSVPYSQFAAGILAKIYEELECLPKRTS